MFLVVSIAILDVHSSVNVAECGLNKTLLFFLVLYFSNTYDFNFTPNKNSSKKLFEFDLQLSGLHKHLCMGHKDLRDL